MINLYYLNELYGDIARHVCRKMRDNHGIDISITSGIWGGTYLIAHPDGTSRRRIWRLYLIVNLPQNSPLDRRENMEHLVGYYYVAFINAFRPYQLDLDLKMWGGRLPFSNKVRPTLTLHMADASERVRWLRAFFVWNLVPWEESIIHDAVRNVKELKQSLDINRNPIQKNPQEIKYLLQDVIITYRTLEKALTPEFLDHAQPIIQGLMDQFMSGLHDSRTIQEEYHKVRENRLIYGLEEGLDGPFAEAGLDVRNPEDWPVDKINWVPDILKEKLIPGIQELFNGFKNNLEKKSDKLSP